MIRKQFIQSRGPPAGTGRGAGHSSIMMSSLSSSVPGIPNGRSFCAKSGNSAPVIKKQPGYTQAIEHIGFNLQGYELFTFNMVHVPNPDNPDVAVLKDFERRLDHCFLRKEGTVWCSDCAPVPYPDEISFPESLIEGAKKQITVNAYERDPGARRANIEHHSAVCKCCGFDFEKSMVSTVKGSFTYTISGL